VLLIAVFAVLYFRSANAPEKVTVVNTPPVEGVNANTNAVTIATPSPVPTAPSDETQTPTHVAQVDLRDYLPQRGNGAGEEPPPLQMEQKPTVFRITLPEGSPAGTYSVSILDAFGKQVKSRTSYSADGRRLEAMLNLNNLQTRKYRLCVSRSNEPPNCYRIVITNRGK